MTKPTFRCAIYTRKSSDEGLDQSFNSLDAQREAGEAYVKSQAHEGWKAISTLYDDGGYSGGSMDRPALQRLLADVDAGLIDVVVVYKIDRLTRSLPDFARIVERFDARQVSFVSVTQAFNTTSSMGRLTLNVLLSFAQFEREVTGERIRDKIAASKAKGMWMGGTVPLGYDLPAPGTHTLQVNAAEAQTVREIFNRYLELQSVHALERELAKSGITSKRRVTRSGKVLGGVPINRGALFHLLRNRTCLGEIPHKGAFHPGTHQAILDQEIFDRVGSLLDTNARRHRATPERRIARAPLTGRLFDANGAPMSPSFSRGKSGRHYRYYVSTAELKGSAASDRKETVHRISSSGIEKFISEVVGRWLPGHQTPIDVPLAVRVKSDSILLDMPGDMLEAIELYQSNDERVIKATRQMVRIELPVILPLRGGKRMFAMGRPSIAQPDPILIAALRKAHRMLERQGGMPVLETSPVSPYDRKLLRLGAVSLIATCLQSTELSPYPPTLSS